ncbi:D-sedoheptulose 7-phosphate isomerase [Lachnospira multipara]|uniref:D-sedoheptulose 7-phosphate isomerase n=1 Tax=Lachnospira multipara TaxID=28051 RepID=UPI0003F77BF1|nr:D-sedoheptulose 7-phosphate isomerase [Lachnospira multipara]
MYKRFNEIMEQQRNNLEMLIKGDYAEQVSKVVDAQINSLKNGGKVMIAGNGGSAADAQHFAGEFVGRFLKEREGLPAIALTTDSSVLTCIGNDYGYDSVFARQINALGKKGDVFIGISTSGNSENIIKAFEECKKKGIVTVALLGKDGGKLKDMADLVMLVPLMETPRVQEIHTMTVHMMCEMAEEMMF